LIGGGRRRGLTGTWSKKDNEIEKRVEFFFSPVCQIHEACDDDGMEPAMPCHVMSIVMSCHASAVSLTRQVVEYIEIENLTGINILVHT